MMTCLVFVHNICEVTWEPLHVNGGVYFCYQFQYPFFFDCKSLFLFQSESYIRENILTRKSTSQHPYFTINPKQFPLKKIPNECTITL